MNRISGSAAILIIFVTGDAAASSDKSARQVTWPKEPTRVFGVAFGSTEREVRRIKRIDAGACFVVSTTVMRACDDPAPPSPFRQINYAFIRDRLVMIDATFSFGDADNLLRRFVREYGDPTGKGPPNDGFEGLMWRGKTVSLIYRPAEKSDQENGSAVFILTETLDRQ